ncbi:MAG TPA: CU044_2847 family protein [Longimicrobium sp.]|nr:CU044_2847 family protein [Longimicrobium sp.]
MPDGPLPATPPLLVELTPHPGVQQVALVDARAIADRSAAALQHAFATIREVAARVVATLDEPAHRPDEVEVVFGLKLTTEGRALIASAGVESTISVKLVFKTPHASNE